MDSSIGTISKNTNNIILSTISMNEEVVEKQEFYHKNAKLIDLDPEEKAKIGDLIKKLAEEKQEKLNLA